MTEVPQAPPRKQSAFDNAGQTVLIYAICLSPLALFVAMVSPFLPTEYDVLGNPQYGFLRFTLAFLGHSLAAAYVILVTAHWIGSLFGAARQRRQEAGVP